jgi:hypothetical protein
MLSFAKSSIDVNRCSISFVEWLSSGRKGGCDLFHSRCIDHLSLTLSFAFRRGNHHFLALAYGFDSRCLLGHLAQGLAGIFAAGLYRSDGVRNFL